MTHDELQAHLKFQNATFAELNGRQVVTLDGEVWVGVSGDPDVTWRRLIRVWPGGSALKHIYTKHGRLERGFGIDDNVCYKLNHEKELFFSGSLWATWSAAAGAWICKGTLAQALADWESDYGTKQGAA